MSQPDPNRFACQQEATLIHEALAADEDDLRGLQQRTERVRIAFSRAESALREAEAVFFCAKDAYEHARALETSLRDEMQRKRGLLHPARKIPDEVWTMIFSVAVIEARRGIYGQNSSNGAQSVALAISSVSKRWRAVAVAHPPLWRFVHIELAPSWTPKKIRSALAALEKHISAHPPRRRFELELVLGGNVTHDKRFRSLFFALGRLMALSRTINVLASDSRTDFHDSFLSQHFHRITPFLESLVLRADTCTEEPEEDEPFQWGMEHTHYGLFFLHCEQLRVVELGNFPLRRFASSRPSAPKIQHINLWNASSLSDRDMADALAMYPSVPSCRLFSPFLEHSDDSTPVTVHTHLRSLLIEANQTMAADFGHMHMFPNLRRVVFRNVQDDCRRPDLTFAIARFIPRSCHQLSRLTLRGIDVTGPLLSVVRGLPHLRTFSIQSCMALNGALFASPTDPAVFPALRRLFLSECSTKGLTGKTLLDFARSRCAKHRRDDSSLPLLKRLGISWTFDDDPEIQAHAGDFLDEWDDKFEDAAGNSDWGDSSDDDELEEEFMAYDNDL